MRLSDFDFELPAELIAQAPPPGRADSRLLQVRSDELVDLRFRDLPRLLRAGDLLVMNDTRVIKARLLGRKEPGGGRVEALVERVLTEREALAMLRASKATRPGTVLRFGAAAVTVTGRHDEFFRLEFDAPVLEVLERVNRELGTITVLITHNAAIAAMADRVIRIGSGRIVGIERNARRAAPSEISW